MRDVSVLTGYEVPSLQTHFCCLANEHSMNIMAVIQKLLNKLCT